MELYGLVDSFSAFPCESLLSHIKRRTKVTRYIFQQTVNNLANWREAFATMEPSPMKFTDKRPNNFAIVSNNVIIVVKDVYVEEGTTFVHGNVMKLVEPLYEFAYHNSTNLGIGYYIETPKKVQFSQPICKCLAIPYDHRYLIFPLASATLNI